jgi:toxin ParE1/3/4
MNPLRFHPEAEAELDEAVAFYESRLSGLGVDLRKEVEFAARRIREAPLRWSPYDAGTRRFPVRRFPYLVIYLELPSHLWVVAVAHHNRRPGYWRNRLQD